MKRLKSPLIPASFLLVTLCCLSPVQAYSQDISDTNLAGWYQADAPKGQLLLWRSAPDSLTVFARLPENSDSVRLQLLFLNSLDSVRLDARQAFDSLQLQPLRRQNGQSYFRASLPFSDSLHYLLLEAQAGAEDGGNILAMAVLDPERNFPPPSFYPARVADSLPVMQTFINKNEPLLLRGADTTYTAFLYRKAFDPAAPPMSATPAASDVLAVDSVFQLSADSLFTLDTEGLYFIQQDTSRMSGQSIRVTNPFYPEVGTLEDLSGPIRYISTREEWKRLEQNNFSKEAVDRFWLKIGQTEERAKKMIKGYYEGVEAANRYFTNYKEGWKTDQGMIYILYGAPDVVNVTEGQEEWIYHKTTINPEIKFTFVRVKNPFTDRHLVLLRRKEYTKAHYDTISQWRRGRKTL